MANLKLEPMDNENVAKLPTIQRNKCIKKNAMKISPEADDFIFDEILRRNQLEP